MPRTPILLAWSGGKDAAWTLHVLRQRGDVDVVGLLTTVTQEYERASMQGIHRSMLQAQADATGLPLLEALIPAHCSNADYEYAMSQALADARQRWTGLSTMAFGDLLLEDIRAYREARLTDAGWQLMTPLFGSDTAALARTMLANGLRAELCCVDTQQLDVSFAGRSFDAALLAALPTTADPCGENGEFHTCVHAGPMFDAPLRIVQGGTVLRDGRFAFTDYVLA